MFRRTSGVLELLLVHPGGPLWAKKDEGAWSIPKGMVDPGECDFEAALRETREELGVDVDGEFAALGGYRQPSGKWRPRGRPATRPLRHQEFDVRNGVAAKVLESRPLATTGYCLPASLKPR